MDWLIKIEKLDDKKPPGDYEARFQTAFEKQRSGVHQWIRNWVFRTEADGQVFYSSEEISFDSKVLELIEAGLHSATDIATELKVVKSTVCKAAARLEKTKLIQIRNRQYHSIRYGRP